jgi:hypothetical protein
MKCVGGALQFLFLGTISLFQHKTLIASLHVIGCTIASQAADLRSICCGP